MRRSAAAATPHAVGLLLLLTGLQHGEGLVAPALSVDSSTVSFPSAVLRRFFSEQGRPGARVDAPPFRVASGTSWRISLYPCGGNTEYSGRVGVYLRCLQDVEVDATFSMTLTTDGAPLGTNFACGMTFCEASEAGISVGRCEDWGAHVCDTSSLLQQLNDHDSEIAVAVELTVWSQRERVRGAALRALAEQVCVYFGHLAP